MYALAPSMSSEPACESADYEDEEAATQRSILEELHTISEEVPHHHGPTEDTAQTTTEAIAPERSTIIEPSETPPVVSSTTAAPQEAMSPLATPAKEEQSSTIGITEAPIIVPVEAEGLSAQQVMGTGELAPEEEAATVVPSPTACEAGPSRHEPEGAVEQSIDEVLIDTDMVATDLLDSLQDQNDAFLDHASLFDGIDADAFDDIELSPPVRRQAMLPPIETTLSSQLDLAPPSPTRTTDAQAGSLLSQMHDPYAKEEMPEEARTTSFMAPAFAGFQTGRGKKVTLSEKGLARARNFAQGLDDAEDMPLPATQTSSQLRPQPAELKARSDAELAAKMVLDNTPLQEVIPRQSTLTNGNQGRSPDSKGKAPAAQISAVSTSIPAAQRVERQPFAPPTPIRSSLLLSSQGPSTPLRKTAITSASRFSTPQPVKRNSLGMMPRVEIGRSTGRKRALPRFITPFKGGKRPKAEETEDPASPLRSRPQPSTSVSSPGLSRLYPAPKQIQAKVSAIAGPAVFLMEAPGPRKKLSDVGRPEQVSSMQMIARGVPDEVLVILGDATKASQYAFLAADGSVLRQDNALGELLSLGCTNAKLPWVQNHWMLILWKLAAMVRLDPSCAHDKWSWDEVVRQLLYRYEREINRAQRSCIKRIQEHDSSPARPMVLFVSGIFEEENEIELPSGQPATVKSTILELSDGWYRILAQIDSVLTQTCQRGRLRVGQKLAITGATLDAHGEGKEVMSAYDLSSLKLSANSVSLARWDARLGFAAAPFVATLRSLTPEGGLISLMDVVITKVYPLAYCDVDASAGKPGAPRGEQEEAEEKEAWAKRREDAIQQIELRIESESRRMYDLVEALSDLASDSFLPSVPEDPTGRLEALASQVFDQLISHADPAAAVQDLVIKAGHTILAPWLHNMAKSALLAEDGIGSSRLARDLDRICPPRKVREFRVVRFRDARLPPPPVQAAGQANGNGNGNGAKKKNPYARQVQLHVWDAHQLGEELQEGRRFLVANLIPMSKTAWRKPDESAEVFLSTRRDTKWRPVT